MTLLAFFVVIFIIFTEPLFQMRCLVAFGFDAFLDISENDMLQSKFHNYFVTIFIITILHHQNCYFLIVRKPFTDLSCLLYFLINTNSKLRLRIWATLYTQNKYMSFSHPKNCLSNLKINPSSKSHSISVTPFLISGLK